MASTLGVVVVGVGIAGKVRIRDLSQSASSIPELSRVKLEGFVSRRELKLEGVRQTTLDEALSDPNVHILIICTENDQHELTARRAMEAGKHVLVEFPLALNAKNAQDLKDFAAKKGVVCYEEDISLLTDHLSHIQQLVKTKPPLEKGETWLEGRFNGWVESPERGGSGFHSSIAQIHRLVCIFGDVKPVQAKIVRGESSLETTGTVQVADGGLISIRIFREVLERPKRDTGMKLWFTDGSMVDSRRLELPVQRPAPVKPGLFLQDFMQFMAVLEGEKDDKPLTHVTIRSLEIADQLFELAKNNPESKL